MRSWSYATWLGAPGVVKLSFVGRRIAIAPPATRISSATQKTSTRVRCRKHQRPMSYKNTDM